MKKIEKFVNKVYRLTGDRAPLSYMLPTRHTNRYPLLQFDEDSGTNRELRYSRNQKSVYVDEQDGNAILEPIVFEDGFLNVPKNNQVLQNFLTAHPLNGKTFIEINQEKDASKDLENLTIEVDALIEARKLDIDGLETVYRVAFGRDTSTVSTAELKRDVLVFAKLNPEEFLAVINDPELKFAATVQTFFDEGLLVKKAKGAIHFNTTKNKTRILSVPGGEDVNYYVGGWLKSDEGIESLKMLEKLLK